MTAIPPSPHGTSSASREAGRPQGAAASLWQRLLDLVLSGERRRRRMLLVVFTSSLVYAVSIALLAFGSRRGLFPPGPVVILAGLMGLTAALFYLLIRSGLNDRFADPTLSMPQCMVAQTLAAVSYAITGPAHPGALVLFPMITIFGIFDLDQRRGRLVSLYAVAIVGAVMWWRTVTQPEYYQPAMEFINFVMLSVAMFAVTQVARQYSTMRNKLKTQKLALEQAVAHIRQMATHDDLTGLANRRHVLDQLTAHAMRHMRGGPAFYVALADLDHFKRINDTYGHGIGDDALRTFAAQARTALRNTDVIGRWGGEEFLLLLPETPGGDATPGSPEQALERLRDNLAGTPASSQADKLRVQFSAGLSRYCAGEPVADTIERADRALYAAKAAGRNRSLIG